MGLCRRPAAGITLYCQEERFSMFISINRRFFGLVVVIILMAASLLSSSHPSYAQSADPAAQLRELNELVDQAAQAAKSGDVTAASALFTQFRASWSAIEDSISDRSRESYEAIEDAIGASGAALKQGDAAKAYQALEELEQANQAFISRTLTPGAATPASEVSVQALFAELEAARDALEGNDPATATEAFETFRHLWPDAETKVRVRSAAVYESTEEDMPRVQALLDQGDYAGAERLLEEMIDAYRPLLGDMVRYGVFDAASILLREGLEALLIVAALLAVVRRSGERRQQTWVWGGVAAGLLASLAVAVALTVIFRGLATGSNRETLEGITALVAAGMLFYVSYWLHRKSHLGAWQGYLHAKTSAALATGRVFSLGLLAFLAVFREGAETVLFYAGMAASIQPQDLLLGLSLATLVLIVLGVLVLHLGVRIPMRPFFLVTSALVFYLGFKFIGTGIHALQVAEVLPASPTPFLLNVDLLGLFPTWETLIPQLLVLVAAAVVVLVTSRSQRGADQRTAAG